MTLLALTEPLHHATMLPPSPLFCNRPDEEQSLRLLPRSGFVQVGLSHVKGDFGRKTPKPPRCIGLYEPNACIGKASGPRNAAEPSRFPQVLLEPDAGK